MKNVLLLFMCLLTFACNKVGDSEVTFETCTVKIDNFPRPTTGMARINYTSYNGFDFNKLDKMVYNELKKDSYSGNIDVEIRFHDKDKYGEVKKTQWFTIGDIDADKTKKYKDFKSWQSRYGIQRMFTKAKNDNKLDYREIKVGF